MRVQRVNLEHQERWERSADRSGYGEVPPREQQLREWEQELIEREDRMRRRETDLMLAVVVYGGILLFLTAVLCISAARWGMAAQQRSLDDPPAYGAYYLQPTRR